MEINGHKLEAIAVGIYDTIHECCLCGQRGVSQADNPGRLENDFSKKCPNKQNTFDMVMTILYAHDGVCLDNKSDRENLCSSLTTLVDTLLKEKEKS